MLVWVLASGWIASRDGGLRAFLSGAVPVIALAVVLSIPGSGPWPGPREPSIWLDGLSLLVHTGLPLLLGAEWLMLRHGEMSTPLWIAPCALGLVVFVALLRSSWARPGSRPVIALWAVVAGTCGMFVLRGIDQFGARYLVPAWPALSILAGLGAAEWRPVWRPALVFLVAPFVFSELYNPTFSVGAHDGTACRAEVHELAAAFERKKIAALYCDDFDCYRIAALLDEKFPVSPFRTDRQPEWTAAAGTAQGVGYLFREPEDAAARASLVDAVGTGSTATVERVGSRTLVVLPRTLADWRPESPRR